MSRLSRAPLAVLALAILAATMRVSGRTATPESSPILQRFLSLEEPANIGYRALRHLEARNDKFDRSAWMDVWTESDAQGVFRYSVASQGGSEYIREHVMLPALEAEHNFSVQLSPGRSALTPQNYVFEDRGVCGDGLVTFGVKPRRKDALLVDGSLFIKPDDGDLVRLEGRLVKPPSFWTRRVEIVRWYQRIAGVRMPVSVQSVASVLIAGRSTFNMTYEYESVNGQHVGSPQPRSH